jgi:hypothetical protein
VQRGFVINGEAVSDYSGKNDVIIIDVWFKTSTNMLLLSVYIIILIDQPHREEE